MNTSWMTSGPSFARDSAPLMAMAPSSGARSDESEPWNAPMGVRAAETMKIGGRVWAMRAW